MLSAIFYGRNDDHGTNYAKRVALSLNCLSEGLTAPGDEIVFVDFAHRELLPTVLETIQDTLTDKTKQLLKLFRVRNAAFHEAYARNVAIRNTNPNNRWILSTNSDMIFVPKMGSLSDIVSQLPDGCYLLPRFELSEVIWEQALDRLQPSKNLAFLAAEYRALHLNIIARRPSPILFDNPGDFQLVLRADLFQIGGFDERMVRGWHIDSNLCKRISLLPRPMLSLEHHLLGFHCNHTRKESRNHINFYQENSWKRFVGNVSSACLESRNWGVAPQLEKVVLSSQIHLNRVASVLPSPFRQNYEFLLSRQHYNQQDYDAARVFVYLSDHLVHLPEDAEVVYMGHNAKMLVWIEAYLKQSHPRAKLHSKPSANAHLFIFDFGFDREHVPAYRTARTILYELMSSFIRSVKQQRHAKYIGINAARSDFCPALQIHLALEKTTYVTGLMVGYPRRQGWTLRGSLKKRLTVYAHYLIVLYLYRHTDRLFNLFSKIGLIKNALKEF